MDDKRAERIEDKLDKVSEDIGEINKTLSAQHVSLVEHIRRTNLLEKRVDPMYNIFRGGVALIGLITVAAAIAEILGIFKHV